MVEKSNETDKFAHAIARELQRPLRHIESFAELLGKSATVRSDPKCRNYVNTILESARRMDQLMDELFTFTRISQAEMYRLHLGLSDLVTEVIHELTPNTEGRSINWVIGDLPEVVGDPVLLWLALENLISNAIKFTRLRTDARIEIGCHETARESVVFVRDNGVGFEADRADELFEVFHRLHASEYEGAGIGLANVRRIIERHGGRVWAEGKPDEGATFYISLPNSG